MIHKKAYDAVHKAVWRAVYVAVTDADAGAGTVYWTVRRVVFGARVVSGALAVDRTVQGALYEAVKNDPEHPNLGRYLIEASA